MAFGRDAAAELWQAAADGRFRLEADAARECAGYYDWFAQMMKRHQDDMRVLQRLDGFGGFESAGQLQSGFERKAGQAIEALQKAEESALRMKAAILHAAGLIEEVDAASAAAIRVAGKENI
ncbi:hypothetical protein [Nocardia abscessus]|uniref:hypothetical protein n=1 Tax=Nocardia abscessus TaxID=120957 RepID=UPI00245849F9|nr:hypothetical protein [Nocardia abscessus]